MLLTIRQIRIIEELLNVNHIISIEYYMNKFNLSKRTIQYDVQSINYFLKSNNLSEIDQIRGKGLRVKEKDRKKTLLLLNKLTNNTVIIDSAERYLRILFTVLIQRNNNIEYFSKLNNVSRNTTVNDIRYLKSYCKQHSVQLSFKPKYGYNMEGTESQIRFVFLNRCFKYIEDKYFNHLLDVLDIQRSNIYDDINQIENLLSNKSTLLNFTMTDEMKSKVAFMIFIMRKRVNEGNILNDVTQENSLMDYKIMSVSKEIFMDLGIKLSVYDVIYLSKFLLSANKLQSNSTVSNDVKNAVEQLMRQFIENTEFKINNKNQLRDDLILHIESLYYRTLFDVEWINPIGNEIDERYFNIYYYTNLSITPINRLVGKEISKNEISYIALIFGANLRLDHDIDKVNIGIVSDKGKSTTRLLYLQLVDMLGEGVNLLKPITVSQFNKLKSWNVDYIISTYPIKDVYAQVILVDYILKEEQKDQINQIITSAEVNIDTKIILDKLIEVVDANTKIFNYEKLIEEIGSVLKKGINNYEKYSRNVKDYFPLNHINVIEKVRTWQEAIELATIPLIKDKSVTENYLKAMINQINLMGPYVIIAPKIAFPHASQSDGALKAGISILKINEEVNFSNNDRHKVNLIIVIASTNDYDEIIAMKQLIELINSKDFLDIMLSKRNSREIKEYINRVIIQS